MPHLEHSYWGEEPDRTETELSPPRAARHGRHSVSEEDEDVAPISGAHPSAGSSRYPAGAPTSALALFPDDDEVDQPRSRSGRHGRRETRSAGDGQRFDGPPFDGPPFDGYEFGDSGFGESSFGDSGFGEHRFGESEFGQPSLGALDDFDLDLPPAGRLRSGGVRGGRSGRSRLAGRRQRTEPRPDDGDYWTDGAAQLSDVSQSDAGPRAEFSSSTGYFDSVDVEGYRAHSPASSPRPEEPPELVPGEVGQQVGDATAVPSNEVPSDEVPSDNRQDRQTKTSRAGRNLPAAIGVGVGLGGAVVVSLLVSQPAFVLLVAMAVVVATWEMVRAIQVSGTNPPLVPLLVGGPVTAGLAWFGGPEAVVLGLVATVLAATVWRLGDGVPGYQRDVMAATLIAMYVPFLASFAILLARPTDGAVRVLIAVAGVVLSDTGGYAVGVIFGRHPMAPRVSPKKSWEGFAGSLVCAAGGSAALVSLLMHSAIWHGVVLGVTVSVAAVLGDLAESLIKRDLGVKDMSNLLPGHGGLMDRLDSILIAAPTAYAVLTLLVPVAS